MDSQGAMVRLQDERGTAVLEFAIVAVIFLGLVYGAISYGVIFWMKATITHAAEEGARAAIGGVSSDPDPNKTPEGRAKAKVVDVVDKGLPAAYAKYSDGTVASPAGTPPEATVGPCANDPAVSCITVTVTYPYKNYPVLPALPPIFPVLPDQLKSTSVVQLTN
jgi:Flp pilus assembly protein TadG